MGSITENAWSIIPEPELSLRGRPGGYVLALLLVFAATLVSIATLTLAGSRSTSLPFMVALVVVGIWCGMRPALTAAIAAFLSYNFLVADPQLAFSFEPADVVVLVSFLLAALLVGAMAGQLSDRTHAVTDQLRRLTALLAASRDLSVATAASEVAQSLARTLKSGSNIEAAIWSVNRGERTLLAMTDAVSVVGAESDEDLKALVLAGKNALLRDLRTARGTVGLVAMWTDRKVETPAASDWLEALLKLGAIAFDRTTLAEDVFEARLIADREGLRTALLSSLSHDLRTPIATILASASSLLEHDSRFDGTTRRELLDTIQEQAERLNRYVSNLLDMTRLETGVLALKRALMEPAEAMISALEQTRRRLVGRRVERAFTASNVMISVDPVLIEQALVNILENAAEFSPPGSIIRVGVAREDDEVMLVVADQGPGVSAEERPQVFDKFFRGGANRRREGGVGLGLAVAKGIVEAFGGQIGVESPVWDGRGARFIIRLPAQQAMEPKE
ncbi:ATP-binding protein [Bradyrhizobium sp.]|uniref:ATP-binding protein n=1 Tax=Bradyrhizobium sp. TaxID=376 RepID=UPI0026103841|nr:ATP-binding protein [Bradyrhizobium sp.]